MVDVNSSTNILVINLLPPASHSDLKFLDLDRNDFMRLLVSGEWTICSFFERHYPSIKEIDTQLYDRCSFLTLLRIDNGGSRKQSRMPVGVKHVTKMSAVGQMQLKGTGRDCGKSKSTCLVLYRQPYFSSS